MSWKEEQEPEGASTVLNKVDKGDNQIPHEDQEHKEDNLPTKRARRLPTTRHTDFFMAGHQHEPITAPKYRKQLYSVSPEH